MSPEKLKQLEFLQANITRMAANSFLIKGWSVTLGTAVLGFSVKESNWALALIAVIPVTSFWLLDAYYLALERLFRGLWDQAIKAETPGFGMSPGAISKDLWCEAAWRPAVWLTHLPIIVISLLASITLAMVSLSKP